MATELFTVEYTSGETVNLRIWNSDGEVLDFNDNTFKEFDNADTPDFAMTEVADMAGAGRSVYLANVDMALLNATATPAQFACNSYVADEPVGHLAVFTVAESASCSRVALSDAIVREGYRTSATTAPTLPQMIWEIWAFVVNFRVVGEQIRGRNVAGSEVMICTTDDSENPTSRIRTS